MADFVAVLRKTIDGLGENTPEVRSRVYDKARSTVAAKLAAIQPPPPAAVIERQKASLEQAIKDVEADYATATVEADDNFDDLDAIIGQLSSDPKPAVAAAAKPVVTPAPPPPPVKAKPVTPVSAPAAAEPVAPPPVVGRTEDPVQADTKRLAGEPVRATERKRAGSGGLIAVALIALTFLGAAGYAIWLNKDEVARMVGMGGTEPSAQTPATPAQPTPAAPASTEPATAAPEEEVVKFTQKLNSDGSETDSGPAAGEGSVGEGTSVAELTVPPPAASQQPAPATDPAATPAAPVDPATPAAPAAPAAAQPPAQTVAVGQRAIFYEERTSATDGSAQQGNTVWTLVQESPGNGLPPEPAIRAEATIPGKEVQLRMTIRRNADATLPASHIIELIFLTPENFDGGVIDNVLRMTFKETEEATGMPVVGSPAKIGDGFFLIALGDTPQEIEANMQLFRRMKWIDIPIVYRTGRRALMTLERGIPGDKVFDDALKAWAAAGSG
jgi:hypothetical protein